MSGFQRSFIHAVIESPKRGSCKGCGGGGRIAIWYDIDETDAAFKERVVAQGGRDDTASEEVQKWYNGEDGTVYWKQKTGLRVFVR